MHDDVVAVPRPPAWAWPVVLAVFAVGGGWALVHEIVWFQLLQLSLGSSAVSLAVLLGTFMGGLGFGSFIAPKVAAAGRHPLAVYAALEAGIAVCGAGLLWAAPTLGSLYAESLPAGYLGIVIRGLVAAICLLPPTVLMGATMPVLAGFVARTPAADARLGMLYAGNLAGAVCGCLVAAYGLLPRVDLFTAGSVAVAGNLAVAALAAVVARFTPAPAPAAPAESARRPLDRNLLVALGLSGLTALAAEVAWTRLLALQIGGSVFAFAIILAVFLAGLGLGSAWASSLARATGDARTAFGLCQLLLPAGIAWAAFQLAHSLPAWPINPSLGRDAVATFQLDLVRCLWAVLPATFLWGASFPLAVAALARGGDDPATRVAAAAAANTLGAIAGAVAGAPLVWMCSSQGMQRLLILVAAVAAGLALAPVAATAWRSSARGRLAVLSAGCLTLAWAAGIAWLVPPVSPALVAYGRFSGLWGGDNQFVYVGEGLQASVAVTRTPTGLTLYHNAGKVQASSMSHDMRLQRLLGHLTTLVPESPREVLVIGCGAGVTAEAVSLDPRVESETIVEIEPIVPGAVLAHFSDHNGEVLRDPKVRVVIDDGRHHLLSTSRTYDAITSDPLDPWVRGAATLYTREFFELAKSRLRPGGVFTLFVQLYQTSDAAVKSQLATFFEVFSDGLVIGNTLGGMGYDLVLLGQPGPTVIDVDEIARRLDQPEFAAVRGSLADVGIRTVTDLFASCVGGADSLREFLADAEITTDRNLRLQYLAGANLNRFDSGAIYARMLAAPFRFPAAAFRGSPDAVQAVEAAMHRGRVGDAGERGLLPHAAPLPRNAAPRAREGAVDAQQEVVRPEARPRSATAG
jgi:spermidine synthase